MLKREPSSKPVKMPEDSKPKSTKKFSTKSRQQQPNEPLLCSQSKKLSLCSWSKNLKLKICKLHRIF